ALPRRPLRRLAGLRDLEDLLHGDAQRLGHFAVTAVAQPRFLRLAAAIARPQSRHGLEVGRQHDRAAAAGDLADLAVDDTLRLDGRHAARRVAVVDYHVRDAARVRDAREQRHVPLAAALEHEDPLLVRVDAERLEDER